MRAADIRSKFLSFFESKAHTTVASSPLVPLNDPTLMFTNSGMVQFKDVFLGQDSRPYVRATSCQACLRAGGKHNDLENVGYTARHHTFFEMLGNWSFGDYFKRDSLLWGWELLTKVYGLPAEKLWATVYHEDDEAYNIWVNEIGLPKERVVRIGDNKGARYASDNFWMMADTGPCGPCSEVFFDHGPEVAGGPPGSVDADGDRFIEIWNHVFMQFDMQPDGSLKKLPAPCVDTGMGLERLAAILQGKHSNYEIDLFERLIAAAARETHCKNLSSPSLKVIADHIRACSFLIADGVIPSNEGRGYVLRRIIRRAIRHGYKLGARAAFFYRLVPDLVAEMGEVYTRLKQSASQVEEVLRQEEERFFVTIEHGMTILDEALSRVQSQVLDAQTAFKLHDTFGFPLDLTQDVCREHGVTVDIEGFEAAMQRQREQARASGKFKQTAALDYQGALTKFLGYEVLQLDNCKVLALYQGTTPVTQLQANESGLAVLDQTPFYAESGGQVGDHGKLTGDSCQLLVEDTQKLNAEVFGHHLQVQSGIVKVGDCLRAEVDVVSRTRSMRHHSATHLLHKALRQVLGQHVVQKGSLVNAQYTRFDFAHSSQVSDAQLLQIERLVNNQAMQNQASQITITNMDEADKMGAVALFGEKYGDQVRVVDIGESRELCGGTHVLRAGDIGLFKILYETSVAAGVRRIVACCGDVALEHVQSREQTLQKLAKAVRSNEAELVEKVETLVQCNSQLGKQVAELKEAHLFAEVKTLVNSALLIESTKVVCALLQTEPALLRAAVDQAKAALGSGVVVFSVVAEGKAQVCIGVTRDLQSRFDANKIAQRLAKELNGKGGGRADMAMAGGTQTDKLAAIMANIQPHLFHVEPS